MRIKKRNMVLIDYVIAGDRNVIKKEPEMILKCRDPV
jgi:hypothetical protein